MVEPDIRRKYSVLVYSCTHVLEYIFEVLVLVLLLIKLIGHGIVLVLVLDLILPIFHEYITIVVFTILIKKMDQ